MPVIGFDSSFDWQCKYCGVKQRVYIGDTSDLTTPDVEAVRCCSCKRLELICEDIDFCCINGLFDDDDDEPLKITEDLIKEHAYIMEGKPITPQ